MRPRGWSGTNDRALINFASADARAEENRFIYPLGRVRTRRSDESIDVARVGDQRAIETAMRLRHILRGVTLWIQVMP